MSSLPPILGGSRRRGLAGLIALALGQAVAAGVAAFATRDVFLALREAAAVPLQPLFLIACAGCAIAALRYTERVLAEELGQDYAAAVRVGIFKHLSRVSAREVSQRRAGALSMRFVGDLAAVRGWVSLGVSRLVSASVVFPATGVVLVLLDPNLALAAAIPLAIGIGVMILAGPRLGPAHKRLRSRRARLAADMSERVVHAPELRLQGRLDTELKHLGRRTHALIASALERARGLALMRAVPDVLAGVVAASVFFAAFATGASGALAAGALAAVALMIQQLRDLAGVWDRYRAWSAAREKCEDLLRTPRLPREEDPMKTPLPDAPHVLRFDGVETDVLSGLTAKLAPGRKVAVVGGNGAGKSTLLGLASGLEAPHAGSVTFGNRPTVALSRQERRRMITLVTGRSPILAGTMRRALTMGIAERPPDRKILDAAACFGLSEVIERVGGLDGKIAEAGRNLSAGQARRVLLARAAMSRSRLLLLDEPDDALDAQARALVLQLVKEAEATVIVITHDLALARSMDEIWLMDGGRLVERGPPDALLQGMGPAATFFAPRAAA